LGVRFVAPARHNAVVLSGVELVPAS
jgi:hypothetical protein